RRRHSPIRAATECSTATTSPPSARTSRSRAMWALSPLRRRAGVLRRAFREENAFSLIELLVASSLMIVVMGGVYGALTTFQNSAARTTSQNDAQERARAATDMLAGQLRNLVMPANPTGGPLEQSGPYDVVFETIIPSGGGGSNSRRVG